jgi:hypothetical protein
VYGGQQQRPVISVREIEMSARAIAEKIGFACLPGAIKDGHYLKAGSIGGERGNSLVLNLAGANRGMWRDHSMDRASPGGAGDMIGLVEQCMFGGDRGKAVAWLKSELGLDHLDPARIQQVRAEAAQADADMEAQAARDAEAKKRGARALWLNGQESIADTPASRYLEARGIRVDALGHWPGALRYHPDVWNRDAGIKLPCLVSQMILPTGEHVATHRTWLGRDRVTREWVKADAADLAVPKGAAKKVLGKSGGAFVPLRKGASQKAMGQLRRPETLYVTEGIEDALTVAMCKPDARIVAAYSLGNLGAIQFPDTIPTIVLVADRDDGEREQEALERAIARQQARGHTVKLVLPPVGFKDINAWLQAGMEAAA